MPNRCIKMALGSCVLMLLLAARHQAGRGSLLSRKLAAAGREQVAAGRERWRRVQRNL